MAKLTSLLLALSHLTTLTSATHPNNTTTPATDPTCCKFTISSTVGDIDCPAGELLDGQIRLNGTYDTSTFCISPTGGVTNARGFGCIVTEAPTTQFQCDEGKAPTEGFSIASAANNNTLLFRSSSRFYLCPATDTEYNIYINPEFGQEKCFPVMLRADGGDCGGRPGECPSPPPPERETVWVTEWATSTQKYMVTETWTSLVPCSTSSSGSNNVTKPCARKGGCHHEGGASSSSPVWTNGSFTGSVPSQSGGGSAATTGSGALLPPSGGVSLPSAGPVGGGTETTGRAPVVETSVARRWWWGGY